MLTTYHIYIYVVAVPKNTLVSPLQIKLYVTAIFCIIQNVSKVTLAKVHRDRGRKGLKP